MAEATVLAQPEAASAPTAARADVSRPARVERRTTAPRRVAAGAGALLRRPALVLSLAVLALVALAAVAPHVLAPGDPLAAAPDDKLRAPSAEHLFGTDQLGRDVLTRVVHGTRLSLSAAGLAVALGVSAGAGLGLVAGYVGGRLDAALMRVCDVLLAVPAILLSLAVVAALGFGTLNVAIAVGVGSVATCARLVRSQVLSVGRSPYVEAAVAGGASRTRVLARHVLPNAVQPVLTLAALELGQAVLAVSSLSFLGFGPQPPTPEWGALVAGGRDFLATSWWLTTLPGLAIVATVLATSYVSRSLERDGGDR